VKLKLILIALIMLSGCSVSLQLSQVDTARKKELNKTTATLDSLRTDHIKLISDFSKSMKIVAQKLNQYDAFIKAMKDTTKAK